MELNVLEIQPEEIQSIRQSLSRCPLVFDDATLSENLFEAQSCFAQLPLGIRRAVFELKSEGQPALLLRGLGALIPFVPTPQQRNGGTQSPEICQTLLGVLSAGLGYVYRFSNKSTHDYFDDIFPVESDAKKQIGTNSVFLDWHVEDAPLKGKADYLCMLCIRPDRRVSTLVFHGKKASRETFAKALSNPAGFSFKTDLTFSADWKFERPSFILEGSSDPEFIYDPSYMNTHSADSNEALIQMKHFVEANHLSIQLEKGDVLILDNRRVAHARTQYAPRFDGTDRWLLRSLVMESTWKMKDLREEQRFVLRGDR